ncbi:MAG TPA: DUF3857 and transglutaminase domain-containing protein [Rhizomicrobium sp.]|nr:DUF3857 and transglutaminase domain-containing protein [Rhizomicrobium sp.]
MESREVVYRALTEAGARTLRQVELSYTEGYQTYTVLHAYTLKKDGTRVDVPREGVMHGFGVTSTPGFQDLKTISVVFPNVEVGDEVALTTVFGQTRPWFGQSYTEDFIYGRSIAASDVSIGLTAPSDMHLQVEANGLTEQAPETLGGKTRRIWHYQNHTPIDPEDDQVDDYDSGARLVVSTFKDFREFAGVYSNMLSDRTEVTPEIRQLADSLTAGLKSDTEKARVLYDWVSVHIAYLDIVLGAGGFVPHKASEVLANKYGDCKDHVILLQALLAAKGIRSTPVLINAEDRFTLSPSPSPLAFNHLISYVPSLQLYLDSTARYAPFGVLPYSDASKPVVRIEDGATVRTPRVAAAGASVRAVSNLTVAPDGTIDGDTQIVAMGAPAADLRALMTAANAAGQDIYIHKAMGPGVEARVDLGNINDLSPTYRYSAHYHEPNALNVPGPATIPFNVAYKPFSFTGLVAGDLPGKREKSYVCRSMDSEEDLTIHLPANLHVMVLPRAQNLATDEMGMTMVYSKPDPATVHADIKVHVDHPSGACTPEYYARVHASITQMTTALRAQILYQ